ncbi:MAG TPA: hypothetical protein VFN71_09475 [Methylomirabilota bacterium]|nr:hypothetical protein [Methylomirabilota bacterium]
MTIKALTFDTYGTVVDWRTSLPGALRAFAGAWGIALDGETFLAEWKACDRPGSLGA